MKKLITVLLSIITLFAISNSAFAISNYLTNASSVGFSITYEFINPNNPKDVTTIKKATIPPPAYSPEYPVMPSVDLGLSPDKTHTILHIISASADSGFQSNFVGIHDCSLNLAGQVSNYDLVFRATAWAPSYRFVCFNGQG